MDAQTHTQTEHAHVNTNTLKGIMCQTLYESKERNFLLELCSRGLLPSCSYTRTSTRMTFPFAHLASPTFVKTAGPPMALNSLQSQSQMDLTKLFNQYKNVMTSQIRNKPLKEFHLLFVQHQHDRS